jgi:hypothetical protein
MSHSTHVGFNGPVFSSRIFTTPDNLERAATFAQSTFGPVSLWSRAFGVGQMADDEDAMSAMGGTDEGRRYAIPLRVIPEIGQITEDISESTSEQTRDVLDKDSLRAQKAKAPNELRP